MFSKCSSRGSSGLRGLKSSIDNESIGDNSSAVNFFELPSENLPGLTQRNNGIRPYRIKEQEVKRINPFYHLISSENSEKFYPKIGITYLWVLKNYNEVVVGIENSIFNQITNGMGHPTLAANFTPTGEVNDNECRAIIGGEIKFKNGVWELDNNSGRFGQTGDPELDQHYLEQTKAIILRNNSDLEIKTKLFQKYISSCIVS